ncbi:MAG: CAAX prenyl protease-related protein [Proteobacteria bacterium]|uniref:CAAX prenyl protease-related protein n=1 Tax=Aquabacterium sp. TaxID=1872578 RepID=UPI0035C6A3D0|nr:CAAX prenyl protease-related protein [Pseudomonadota bacterium]
MTNLLSRAAWARVIPFVLFMALLALRGQLTPSSPDAAPGAVDGRWVYGLAVVLVTASLIALRHQYTELLAGSRLRWQHALLSIAVGLVVFKLWISLTEPWMMLGQPAAGFRPVNEEGELMWGLIAVRWVGAALMVPVMEELFWRGFLMRWVDNPDFEKVDPASVSLKAIALSTLVFMLAHTLWLGAIVAGLAYALLYRYTRSLWAAVLAHAVTNGVLGVWVVVHGNWAFW